MATFKREIKKLPSEQNLRLLSSLVISLANKTSSVEDKCISPWKAGETYQKDVSFVVHNGYIYSCSVTNKDAVFTESHWMKLADSFDEISVDTVKSWLNLSQEELDNLQSLIDDTAITTTKTNSSSKIYMDIQAAIAECKDDTLKQIAKKVSGSYKIAASTSDVISSDYIYLINNGSNYDLYVLVDSVPTKVGDTTIDLDDYYTKTEVDNDFLKKTDATSTYATITTVDGKVNKTSILATKDNSATDDQVYSAKVINDELLKIANDTYIENADNPTSTICKANGDTLNTPYKKGLTNASISLIISTTRGREEWNGQLSITMASNDIYVRNKGADGWCTWQKVCVTSVNDVPTTVIVPTFPSTVTLGPTQKIYYSIKNGWANVSIILNLSASPKLTWTEIVEGLPKPDKEINTSSFGETAVNNASVGFRIGQDGILEILVGSAITKPDWWNVNFTYPVA